MEGFYEPRAIRHKFRLYHRIQAGRPLAVPYDGPDWGFFTSRWFHEVTCGLRLAGRQAPNSMNDEQPTMNGAIHDRRPSGPYYRLLVMGAGVRRRQQHQRIASQTGMMRTAVSMSGIWVIMRTMKQRKARQK